MRSSKWIQCWLRILSLLAVLATVASSACQADSKGGPVDGGAGSSGTSSGGNSGSAGEAGGGSDAGGTAAAGSHTGGSGGIDTGHTDTGGTDTGGTDAGGTDGGGTDGGGTDGGGTGGGGTGGGGTDGGGTGGGGTGGGGTGGGGTGGTDDNDGLPRALDFAGPPQEVAEAQGQELTFSPPDGSNTIDIIVLFSPPGTTAWTPVPASPGAADVTVVADEPGTYAPVIVDTSPPLGCTETVWGGSVSATSNSALAKLEGYTHVVGNLTLEGTVDDLSPLRCLTEIRGALTIAGSAIETATFPNLARVHGDLLVEQAEALTRIAAPNLRLAGALTLTELSALRAVDFGGLAYGYGTELSTLGSSPDEPIELDFSWLVDIRGSLSVTINAGLTSLDGFSALQSVANVSVFGNSLENANGLRKLESVQEIFFEGTYLTSIDLSALRQLERLELSSVPALTSLKISRLEEIETEIVVYDVGSRALGPLDLDLSSLRRLSRLSLEHVVNLETLGGLSALEEVEEMEVLRGDSLRTAALEALASTELARFDDNPNLETIALPSLTTLGYSDEYSSGLELTALPRLTTVAMSSIEEIAGSIRVEEVGAAADAELTLAFGGLRTVRGTVWFSQVANLLDLDGFLQLHEVGVSLQFHQIDGLVDATGLSNLETVAGCVIFHDSPHLAHISLVSLVEAGYGGCPTVSASDLPELMSLDVSSLGQTVGGISLRNLAELADGDLTVDFSSLGGAGGLTVSGVNNLASVDAFSALTELSGNLVIEDNPELASLAGFDQLVTFGAYGFFTVTGNTALSECEPLELLDRLEAAGFHGTVSVNGNMADTCD